jgi:hypothetical protein
VTTGIGVNVLVYDECVSDEYGQRMSGQQISRENPREYGQVAENAVDLELVHTTEISLEVTPSAYLDAGIELLMQG